jgi:hypothetical protein
MARLKKTARVVDSSKAIDSTSDVAMSFEFGLSRATLKELDEFTKMGWFPRDFARLSEGEVIPDPRGNEVVVYKEFFVVGLRFPPHSLVIGVLKRFNLKFHQLNPSSFVKLSIYVWSCKSQGVEPDLEGFLCLQRVHPQPHKMNVEGETILGQFRVYAFVYHHGVDVLVQAQKNKWASLWTKN